MAHIAVTAEKRDGARKSAARQLRREGMLPASLYGGTEDPVKLKLKTRDVEKFLSHESRNVLLDITVVDGEKTLAMIKEVQSETISRRLQHIDFVRISADAKVAVSIPIHVINAEEVKKLGGLVQLIFNELEVLCLPDSIPEQIVVDIAGLKIGHTMNIGDLTPPEGAEFVAEEDEPVVSILTPKVAKVGAELAQEAAAEGDAAKADDKTKAAAKPAAGKAAPAAPAAKAKK